MDKKKEMKEGGGYGGRGGGIFAVGAAKVVKKHKVSFLKLFTFADRLDVILMVVGTISAVANGVSQPLTTVIFGNLINSFGSSDPSQAIQEVSKVCFLAIFCKVFFFFFFFFFFPLLNINLQKRIAISKSAILKRKMLGVLPVGSPGILPVLRKT
jgi:hypothetical protein